MKKTLYILLIFFLFVCCDRSDDDIPRYKEKPKVEKDSVPERWYFY